MIGRKRLFILGTIVIVLFALVPGLASAGSLLVRTDITLTTPAPHAVNENFALTGSLFKCSRTPGPGTVSEVKMPVAGRLVKIYRWKVGTAGWNLIGTRTTSAAGKYGLMRKEASPGKYQYTAIYSGSCSEPGSYTMVEVTIRP
jgi:hypothetical protein